MVCVTFSCGFVLGVFPTVSMQRHRPTTLARFSASHARSLLYGSITLRVTRSILLSRCATSSNTRCAPSAFLDQGAPTLGNVLEGFQRELKGPKSSCGPRSTRPASRRQKRPRCLRHGPRPARTPGDPFVTPGDKGQRQRTLGGTERRGVGEEMGSSPDPGGRPGVCRALLVKDNSDPHFWGTGRPPPPQA